MNTPVITTTDAALAERVRTYDPNTPEQQAIQAQELQRAAAAKGITLATSKDEATGVVISHATGQRVNAQVQARVTKILQNTVKQTQGLTGQIFRMIRECGDYAIAVGTFSAAEAVVIREAKVKSINQLSKLNFGALASYMAIKSTLFGAVRDHEDLAIAVQALWNWNNEKEGAEKKIIPDGYMDCFSERYADSVKGSSLFMSDYRQAKPAADDLKYKQQAYERAQKKALDEQAKKQGENTPATNGPNAGIATSAPGGAISDMDKDTLTAVKELTTLLHEVYRGKAITPIELRQWMFARMKDLRDWDMQRRSQKAEAAADAVTADKDEPEVKEAENQGTAVEQTAKALAEEGAAVKAIPEDLVKPSYVTQDDWDADESRESRQWFFDNKEEYLRLKAEEYTLPEVPDETDVLGDDLTEEDKALIEKHKPDESSQGPSPAEDVA